MVSEIEKSFILNTTNIKFDASGISYAACSRTTSIKNICICRGDLLLLFQ